MNKLATACPKCGYIRGAGLQSPAWQCPHCGIAYTKYQQYLKNLKASVAPRDATADLQAPTKDASIWALIASNLIAIALAILQDWSLVDLMFIYWVQSLIIGIGYLRRILALDKFTTKGFTINNRQPEPTVATKRQTAGFFAVHYGFFHIGYIGFMLGGSLGNLQIGLGTLFCCVVFAVNHQFSYRYHRQQDQRGIPNVGTLMFTPYARIVPMHLMIILGSTAFSMGSVLLFGLLKTLADVVMHYVEHRHLATPRRHSSELHRK